MQTITMRCVDRLERKYGAEVNTFLRHVTFSNIDHKDNATALMAMAHKFGVPPAQFSSYVRAKLYARQRSSSYGEIDPLEQMAGQLGWDVDQLRCWLDGQAKASQDEFADEEDTDEFRRRPKQQKLGLNFPDPWEDEDDLLQDMQEDGGQTGD